MKSKRIAILVWGMLREFEYAHKTWKFLNDIEYDIFFSVWDKTFEENKILDIDIKDDVTRESILKYFPNATINIESEIDVNAATNTKKMSYHWKKLFILTKLSDYEYDSVLLIRPDLYIKENNFSNFIKNFNKNHILGLSEIKHGCGPGFHYVQDCLFFGKYDLMRDVFLSFNPPDNSLQYIHYHLAKYFVYNDIYIEEMGPIIIDYFVMRSIHRKILNLDFEVLRKVGIEWWNAKNLNKTPTILPQLNYK